MKERINKATLNREMSYSDTNVIVSDNYIELEKMKDVIGIEGVGLEHLDESFKQLYEFYILARYERREIDEDTVMSILSFSNRTLDLRMHELNCLNKKQVKKIIDFHILTFLNLINLLIELIKKISENNNYWTEMEYDLSDIVVDGLKNEQFIDEIYPMQIVIGKYLDDNCQVYKDDPTKFRIVYAYSNGDVSLNDAAIKLDVEESYVLQMVDVINQFTINDVYNLIEQQQICINYAFMTTIKICLEILAVHNWNIFLPKGDLYFMQCSIIGQCSVLLSYLDNMN